MKETIKFIDLFAGIGGLRLGFEQALQDLDIEGESVFVSEIKEHAKKAYSQNFSNEKISGDITEISTTDIPDFDYLLAGFPCQAFSSAGNRLGFEDTRGTLFFDVARILKDKRPDGFLLENVEGLVEHNKGQTLDTMLTILQDLGYYVSYKLLDSKLFGLAQSRTRIYLAGSKVKFPNLEEFKKSSSIFSNIIEKDAMSVECEFSKRLLKYYKIEELYGKSIKDKRGGLNNIHSWNFALKGEINSKQKELLSLLLRQRRNKKWANVIGIDWMDGMPLTIEIIKTFFDDDDLKQLLDDLVEKGYLVYEYPKKRVNNRRIYDETLQKGYNIVTGKLSFKYSKIINPNDVTPTLVATDMSKLAVPVNGGLRSLTPREGLRLFGFPETYIIEDLPITKVYDLLGNTVCVPVVKEVSKRLLKIDTRRSQNVT